MLRPKTEEIIALLAEELEIPASRLNPQSSSETIPEWDSMAQLNICMTIQDRFGIALDLEDIATATSVPALMQLLK
jgi:acyl carrier protein